mgnify:CR=1 FL=1
MDGETAQGSRGAAWDGKDAGEDDDEQRDEGTFTMLVVSRKLGERIKIGEEIEVVVVKIDRNQIRLGVAAPRDVEVYRHEIAPPGRRTSAKRTRRSEAGEPRCPEPVPPALSHSEPNGDSLVSDPAATLCEPFPLDPVLSPDPAN